MPGTERDRDALGRARQARPRDALGRPLPYGADGVEPVSEEPLPPEEALRVARELVDGGRPFSAHEVLEARWKAGPAEERDLWQGLAQACVALTHSARGNRTGAQRLADRAAQRLAAYAATGRDTYGLDPDAVVDCVRRQVGSEEVGGLQPARMPVVEPIVGRSTGLSAQIGRRPQQRDESAPARRSTSAEDVRAAEAAVGEHREGDRPHQ